MLNRELGSRVDRGVQPVVAGPDHPVRTAILLIGGDKTGNDRWYEVNVPIADQGD